MAQHHIHNVIVPSVKQLTSKANIISKWWNFITQLKPLYAGKNKTLTSNTSELALTSYKIQTVRQKRRKICF